MKNAEMIILVMGLVLVIFCFGCSETDVLLFDDGRIHNIDYTINENIEVKDGASFGLPTTVNLLLGGRINASLTAFDNSKINLTGGKIEGSIKAWDHTEVVFSGGVINGNFDLADYSTATISGGLIGGCLCVFNGSEVTISGGSVAGDLMVFDMSQVVISGGFIAWVITAGGEYQDVSVITVVGNNFAINRQSVDYGEFDTDGKDSVHRILTGTLANGDELNNDFYIEGRSIIVLEQSP